MKYLIIGKGYVGTYLKNALPNAEFFDGRVTDVETFKFQMQEHFPSHCVINCAGRTGRPNVDWCEDHKQETFEGNVTLPLVLGTAFEEMKRQWFHIGSGCVYSGYDVTYRETDEPDFFDSYYSRTKIWSQYILAHFYQCCVLRIRMPIDPGLHARSYIGKLLKYASEGKTLYSMKNSMTMLDDLARSIEFLAEHGHVGTWNVVNRGAVEAIEVMEMYKALVDPTLEYKVGEVEEVQKQLKAGRSNCILAVDKLSNYGFDMPEIKDRLVEVMKALPRRSTNG